MTIAVPVIGTRISVATFGKPVVDAVNSHETRVTTLEGFFYRARTTVSVAAATVILSGIPTNLRQLRLVWSARVDTGTDQLITLQVGGDTGSVYSATNVQVVNATVSGGSGFHTTSALIGIVTGSGSTAGSFATGEVVFAPWDNVNSGSLGYLFNNSVVETGAANQKILSGGGSYSGSNGRTSLTIMTGGGLFIAGSDFQLLGSYT